MLFNTLFAATFLALTSFTVAAPPPGCLLGAVNSYKDPSDVKSVCEAKDASKTIAKMCGDDTKAALSAFADICNTAGVKVSTDLPKSSGSMTATSTASASGSYASATASGSLIVMPTGNSTGPYQTGSPKPSGTAGAPTGTASGGAAESTGAAGKLELGIVAVIAGLFAVAL